VLLLDAFDHTLEVLLEVNLCILCVTSVLLDVKVDTLSNVVIFLVALVLNLSDFRSYPVFVELGTLIILVLTVVNGLSHEFFGRSEWFGYQFGFSYKFRQ